MNGSEHLTENQLNDYFGDTLDKNTKHEIGRHLLQCDFCLKRMPKPSPEQFWAALMTDGAEDESTVEKTGLAKKLEAIIQVLKQPKVLVWSAGALVLCLIFTAFFRLNAVKSFETEREIAENFGSKNAQSIPDEIGSDKIDGTSAFPNSESDISLSADSTRKISNRDLPVTRHKVPKQNPKLASGNNFETKPQKNLPDNETVNISSTRGGNLPKCSDQLSIGAAVEMQDKTIVLKWKEVPNAVKYHLYVSDDEEILVDEFETERETSYVLKKPLDPLKTYKWKVIVTLENGNTVIGDSRNFTMKDFQTKQKKLEKKRNSEIRCSAEG